jgi:hypothetical protein
MSNGSTQKDKLEKETARSDKTSASKSYCYASKTKINLLSTFISVY